MRLSAYDGETLLWTMDPATVDPMPGSTPNLYVVTGAQAAPPAPSFYPSWPGRVVAPGDTGADVQTWQDRLGHLGFNGAGLVASGTHDPASVSETERFQSAQGISPTGLVDQATWQAAFHKFVGA
jgi:peptidoglycan hydrolase-like protein with peptidoglycan-binding domain